MVESARVLYANHLEIDGRWTWRLSDPFWRLYWNRDDGAGLWHQGRRTAIPSRRVVLVPPWSDCRGECRGRVRHFYIHAEAPGGLRTHLRSPVLLDGSPAAEAMLQELADLPLDDPGFAWRAAAAATWAIVHAVSQAAPEDAALGGEEAARVAPALDAIARDPAAATAVPRLAALCGLSTDHFARRFRAATGRTVMRWVQEQRIARSCDLLVTGDDPLETVAEAVGFANRFHYTRVFTRIIGTPPATYRRQHRG